MQTWLGDDQFVGPFNVPAVVNAAFAVELAFKALLLKGLKSGDPAPEGHELHGLFLKLAPVEQASLRKLVPPPEYPRLPQQADDPFLAALNDHTDVFVTWRYGHENTDQTLLANLTFLTSLAEGTVKLEVAPLV